MTDPITEELEELEAEMDELNPEEDMTWGETEELIQERECGLSYEGDDYE